MPKKSQRASALRGGMVVMAVAVPEGVVAWLRAVGVAEDRKVSQVVRRILVEAKGRAEAAGAAGW